MRLYFIRHGESEANVRHVISNRESAFHLTFVGKQQAEAIADHLRDIEFDAFFCSPVLRARETAEILSILLGIPYQVTEALREYDCGILEEHSDEESWNRHRYYFDQWTLHRNHASKPEGGENFLEIKNRFLPFILSLQDLEYRNVLLLGHGGLFLLMLPLLLPNVSHEFACERGIGHTECIIAESAVNGFVCKQWGDVQF